MFDFKAYLTIFTILLWSQLCSASDPYYRTELTFSYKTVSPLGVPQQVIAVNDQFPGPLINVTTNNNLVINVHNKLDEELLVNWVGIHMRQNPWQDGVLGTTCPIRANHNFTYKFQAKDQIGSFYYFPSLNFQRASGGFGPFTINNRVIIPIPFNQPDGDITIMIGDWYHKNHKVLRSSLNDGHDMGIPDGILINGKGPFQYNDTLIPDGIDYETISVDPGKTYRIRVHNVGISTSLNFRIQNHNLLLVETEGRYTMQQNYTSFDIHVGQSYSFLLSTDQNASSDYYIVASPRFVNNTVGSRWETVTGVAVLHYSNSKGKAVGPLPDPPNDEYDQSWSVNQALSIRQNGTASGARPNPQGSFHYGEINVTNTYHMRILPLATIHGKRRATLNGISFKNPETPIILADRFKVKGDYKLDFPSNHSLTTSHAPRVDTSIINGTYKSFSEIVFHNNDTVVQTVHMDGFSFYVVGMAYGVWTNDTRNQYNKWDAISRCSVQVFPGGWTAIYVYFDNDGAWNIRTENLDRWYLGQETYIKLVNYEKKATMDPPPDNVLYCGALSYKQKDDDEERAASKTLSANVGLLLITLLVTMLANDIFSLQ